MGLLGSILGAPVTLPAAGITAIFKKIQEVAEAQFFNPESVRADLMALGEKLDRGEINEATFEAAETELLDRLDEIEAFMAAKHG
jgi:Gas vesicle protein G